MDFYCGHLNRCIRIKRACLHHRLERYHHMKGLLREDSLTYQERLFRIEHLKRWRMRIYRELFYDYDQGYDDDEEDSCSV